MLTVVFRGTANAPDESTESTLKLSFTSRLTLQRIYLPETRVQKLCPWTFPTRAAQRAEAVSGGTSGHWSLFYNCGYSADQSGGVGSLNSGGCVHELRPFPRAMRSTGHVQRRWEWSGHKTFRRNRVFTSLDPGAELWIAIFPVIGHGGKPGSVQRFCSLDLWNGLVSSSGNLRPQRWATSPTWKCCWERGRLVKLSRY